MLNWLTRYSFVAAELGFDANGALTESVLDVGCGPHGLACAAPAAEFVGVDVLFADRVAPGMVAFRSAPGPLPFDDAAFETVVCLDVLEHLPAGDRPGFVRELARVASRRVLVACPSDESLWVQDVLRVAYQSRGMALPGWLNEHDEHGLPTAEEIRQACTSVAGFQARELVMTNGLLTTLAVMADMLPEFSSRAAAEYRENREEWLQVFTDARFGVCNRKGYAIERELAQSPKVDASDLRDSVWSAVRCPACGGSRLQRRPGGAVCQNCGHAVGSDQAGAINLAVR